MRQFFGQFFKGTLLLTGILVLGAIAVFSAIAYVKVAQLWFMAIVALTVVGLVISGLLTSTGYKRTIILKTEVSIESPWRDKDDRWRLVAKVVAKSLEEGKTKKVGVQTVRIKLRKSEEPRLLEIFLATVEQTIDAQSRIFAKQGAKVIVDESYRPLIAVHRSELEPITAKLSDRSAEA